MLRRALAQSRACDHCAAVLLSDLESEVVVFEVSFEHDGGVELLLVCLNAKRAKPLRVKSER